jgi:hypothetical protein
MTACLCLSSITWLHATVRSQAEWAPSAKILKWVSSMSAISMPGLVPPSLSPEKPFTKGYQDTLFWSSDSVRSNLPSGTTLLFFEIRADYTLDPQSSKRDTVRWGFKDADVDSAVFDNLPENIPIVYTLRYYVQLNTGEYGISPWSKSETSIQDAHIPILDTELTHIIGLQHSFQSNWIKTSICSLDVAARDPHGIVQLIRIKIDDGPIIDDNNFQVSDSIRYTTIVPIRFSPRTPLTLEVSVFDAAGQESNKLAIDLAIWPEEDKSRMMAFPNPFNPEHGQTSIFLPGIKEATIYDLFGHQVLTLRKDSADDYFEWDGRNDSGEPVGNGGYLVVASGSKTRCKIAVVR